MNRLRTALLQLFQAPSPLIATLAANIHLISLKYAENPMIPEKQLYFSIRTEDLLFAHRSNSQCGFGVCFTLFEEPEKVRDIAPDVEE